LLTPPGTLVSQPPPTVLEHPYGTIESGVSFLDRLKWFLDPPFASKFGAMWLDALDDPGPEHQWLIEDYLTIGDRSVMAGDSRVGKSFCALEVSFDIVYGVDFFGKKCRRGGVVYQTGEGTRALKKRIRAIRAHRGLEFTRQTPFVLLQKPIDIYRDATGVNELILEILEHAKIMEIPLLLVVIDTLATASVGADEVSGKDMGVVMENVRRINERTGAHVMLVHHLSAAGRVRGHTSIYANVDQVLLLTRDEETKVRTLTCDKQKDGEEGMALNFELVPVSLGSDETGKEVTSCVCRGISEREAVEREMKLRGVAISSAMELFLRAFFEAEKRYGMLIPRGWNLPAKVKQIVPWEDIKRTYATLSPSGALTPDQQTEEEAAAANKRHADMLKKRLERFRETAVNEGILGLGEHEGRPVLWWTGKPLKAFAHTQPERRDDPDLDRAF
jgi:hypothetical protein